MDISQLLVDSGAEMPRRSSSNAHSVVSVTAQSPSASAAKLAAASTTMRPRRKRHDPKPIWAVLEHEATPNEYIQQQQQQQPRPAPERLPQARPPPALARPPQPPPPAARTNGALQPTASKLAGLERPVTDDDVVYNEATRKVCDFIWSSVIDNPLLRAAVAEAPGTEVEIEARWGQIVDPGTGLRLNGIHATECVVRADIAQSMRFESTMSLEQHKKMNMFLNEHVAKSNAPGSHRERVAYKHTKEVDMLYELDQAGFDMLHPVVRQMFAQVAQRQRVRVTHDLNTGQVIRKLIKLRIGNLEISSPETEWDYRIGINLEIDFPGPVESLKPIVENGRSIESMKRNKDRVSYSYMSAFQIDLTQVIQGKIKNHELELELSGARVLEEADKIKHGLPSEFENLVGGMMNNLRVLSREITPPK